MSGSDLSSYVLLLGVLILFGLGPAVFLVWLYSDRTLSIRVWGYMAFVGVIAGVMVRSPLIAIIGTLILLAIGIAFLYQRAMVEDLKLTRAFSRDHIFPGDEIDVTWTLTNDKPLPFSWLRHQDAIVTEPFGAKKTDGIELIGEKLVPIWGDNLHGTDIATSLGGFETLRRNCKVRGLQRGRYEFGPAHLTMTDILGMYTRELELPEVNTLTVYPKMFPIDEYEPVLKQILGDVRKRSILEDPTWYRGARQYRSSDPMKSIDWRATARTRELQVKTFEPTVHPKLFVVANLHAFEKIADGFVTQHMEDVISTTASVCRWALENGVEVGVHSNGALPESFVPNRIPPSAEDHQFFTILDYLARIRLIVNRSVEEVLVGDLSRLPRGTGIIVCTSVMPKSLANTLTDLARKRGVAVIMVDNNASITIPGVAVTRFAETAAAA